MSTTPLDLYADLWDLKTGATAVIDVLRTNLTTHTTGTVTNVPCTASNALITQWAISRKYSSAGNIKLGVMFGCAFANGVIRACGGVDYSGPPLPYLLRLWRNGGAGAPIAVAWLKGITITLAGANRGILIDTPDITEQFDFTIQGHITYNGAPLSAVLDGSPGFIPITTDPSNPNGGTTMPGTKYPQAFSGLSGLDHVIGLAPSLQSSANQQLMTFSFLAAADTPNFPNTAINADIWDDTTSNGLQTVLRAAAGKFDPNDPQPLGSRVNYHVDLTNNILYCGLVGRIPAIDLQSALGSGTYELNEATQALFNLAQTTISPGVDAMRARVRFGGGPSNHGLPDGWTNTGLETIFPDASPDAAYLRMLVVAGSTGADGGGVYGYLHDGLLRRLSQAFDATCLAYDGTAKTLYAGTPYGVLMRKPQISDLTNTPTWTPVGGLAAKVLALCIPATNIIWALVDEGNGSTSVFQFPAVVGDSDNTDLGFGGWSRIKQGGTITAMAGGIGNLYYVDSSDPTTLLLQTPGQEAQKIPIPNGAGITGLDYLPTFTGIVVRTTGGSANLYAVLLGQTSLINLNPGGTNPKAGGLADQYGYLQVNRVQQSGDTASLNGSPVVLLAVTDAGGFYAAQKPGGAPLVWKRMSALSGASDQSMDFIACSPTQTVLGRSLERVYMASANSLWISNSGSVWAFELLAANLDTGPAWSRLAAGPSGIVPNNVGAICSPDSDFGLVQQNGALGLAVNVAQANQLPKNVARTRTLSPRNDYEYSMVVCDSPAPYFALEIQTLSEITADDSRGVITAAEELDLAEWRFLAENSVNPLTVQFPNLSYWTQESALPQMLTGSLFTASANSGEYGPDGTFTQVVDWQARGFYLLTYDEVKDGSVMKVTLSGGNIMVLLSDALQFLQEIVGGTSLGLARDKRYKRVK